MEDEQKLFDKFRKMFPGTRNSCAWLWIELAYDIADVYGMTPEQYTYKLFDQFTALKKQYGDKIAQDIYCEIQNGGFLPHEMIQAAKYLESGGNSYEIAEMARSGEFEDGISNKWLEISGPIPKEDTGQPDVGTIGLK